MVGTINKASPHDDASVWLDGIGKHVGSIGMSAVVVARTRLSFRIGFYQESAKIWDGSIYLLCLLLPPLLNLLIQWVGSLGVAQSHRRSEVDAEVYPDAIRTQDVGNDLHLINIFSCHHLWRCIHIVEHASVDAQRGVGAGIGNETVVQTLADAAAFAVLSEFDFFPFEDALTGIATFDAAIQIIPMVKDAETHLWFLSLIDSFAEVLLFAATSVVGIGVLKSNQLVGTVEQTDRIAGGDGSFVLNVVALMGRTGVDVIALAKIQSLVYLELYILATPVVF